MCLVESTTTQAQTKLLRFPDIHHQTLVFCYAGDLWSANVEGGRAVRLTAHPGQELFPRFSPDGQWIAFTGQYDGDEQVYVMPATGGRPTQLTYYPAQGPLAPRWGYDHQVYGWTPDGSAILFRSLRDADGGKTETALYTVSKNGGLPQKLPMPTSGAGEFSPSGDRVVYSPLFRDFRAWKRYRGGWAQDLYLFDLSSNQATSIARSDWTERDPMWIGNDIYFVSDRDGTLNLYVYHTHTETTEQVTHDTQWDLRWPTSDGQSRIVFERDGELEIYHTESGQITSVSIDVPDDGLSMRPSRYSAANNIESYTLSPAGERALIVARGDVFTVPIEHGATRNLTNSSDAHDKHARWSPDGRHIAYISDASGEEQLYLIAQDGSDAPQQLTSGHRVMLSAPIWSPDSKKLAYADKDGKLFILTVEGKMVVEITDAPRGSISDHQWSPHSGHLAFSMRNTNGFSSLYIWSVADGQLRQVTDELFHESEPVWDPEGEYLFYLSTRQFAPQISSTEWNYAGNRDTGLFALALRKDVKPLFPARSDEVTIKAAKDTDEEDGKESGKENESSEKATEDAAIRIDFDGLAARSIRIPVDAGNHFNLTANQGHLIYGSSGARYYGRSSERRSHVEIFSLEDRKASTLHEGTSSYSLSADGSKILVRQSGGFQLLDAKPDSKKKQSVSTKGLMVDRVPAQEWQTIFDEVWRRYRDFFYVSNMHGYDWKAIGEQYRPWLQHVAHRSDLNYLIGEMIAELSVGHAYIAGGDFEIPDRPSVALPGARFELDADANRYRIAKIFQGHNEEAKYRAPLTEVGVDITEGVYVHAIDGTQLTGEDNPYRLLQHKTDPVTLTISESPDGSSSRDISYRPIQSESNLQYLNWVLDNRRRVEAMTAGKVGYLHIPDMGAPGIYEFIKWFYPQIRKEGLIIDVRSNGGGNVSQWIIERLDTKLLGTRFGYSSDEPGTYPGTVFHGHLVCLMNETSASDGDIFPHRFRESGLGPLIGKRSWGGVVGISSRGPLLDGGTVYVPLQATNDAEGNYIIEGHGVDPDIIIENDPQSVIRGQDPQLERGVQEVLQRIADNPKRLPKRPADPVKTPNR